MASFLLKSSSPASALKSGVVIKSLEGAAIVSPSLSVTSSFVSPVLLSEVYVVTTSGLSESIFPTPDFSRVVQVTAVASGATGAQAIPGITILANLIVPPITTTGTSAAPAIRIKYHSHSANIEIKSSQLSGLNRKAAGSMIARPHNVATNKKVSAISVSETRHSIVKIS